MEQDENKAVSPKVIPMEPQREVLTLLETCALLRISKSTLLELANTKVVPGRKVGREWRFCRSLLLEWLAQTPDPPKMKKRTA